MRAKFEEWEKTKDAKDQMRQMMLTDENGSSLETASHLKAKFEALKMADEEDEDEVNGAGAVGGATQKRFRPKRFKVRKTKHL